MLFVLKKCCLVELVLLFARCFSSVSESCEKECLLNNQERFAKIQAVGAQQKSNKKNLCG